MALGKNMKRIGITGQSGFIGGHLAEAVSNNEETELVQFEDSYFDDAGRLLRFVEQCDVVVHLAAASRMPSEEELYDTNMGLVRKLIDALDASGKKPLVMFSSSTHETRDTAYGRAKRDGALELKKWATRVGGSFVKFIFPNVFGPGARVHYASFIANFAYELQHGETPKILVDAPIRLVYVKRLCAMIVGEFGFAGIKEFPIPWDAEIKVTQVLDLFKMFCGYDQLPNGLSWNDTIVNLWTTFKSYR